jgi:hypothetical protein
MIAGTRYVLWQKRTGLVAMVLLAGALLALADALVGGLGGSQGLIELTPGNRYQISGPMPPRTEEIKDFVINGQPGDGSVRLLPEAVFTGYWFGGSMWRGFIEVADSAHESTSVIAVNDRFGEKQNPALVFKVQIWPDEATLNAHSSSFLTRKTGYSPYFFAVGLALTGMVAAGCNFLLGRLWARHLAKHHCGEIFKLRRTEQGTEITCELQCADTLKPGMEAAIYRPTGEYLGPATISQCESQGVLMLVGQPDQVHLGDVACAFPHPEEQPTA